MTGLSVLDERRMRSGGKKEGRTMCRRCRWLSALSSPSLTPPYTSSSMRNV